MKEIELISAYSGLKLFIKPTKINDDGDYGISITGLDHYGRIKYQVTFDMLDIQDALRKIAL